MKILTISLLRLGDLLMHQQIFHDLRREYPEAQIDVVINSQFSSAASLLKEVTHVHLFPRTSLQRELVEKQGSFFNAFKALQYWLRSINAEQYDLVFDLTHNFLSHKLTELLEVKEKRQSRTGYFNDVFSISSSPSFHYLEALRGSLGLLPPLFSSEQPRVSENRNSKKISIQPLTSDAKKNWSLQSFQRLCELLLRQLPDYSIEILGAPFEENQLKKTFSESERLKLKILSLENLAIHLEETELLVSGDTATVHLAVQSQTPIVGLYLGSADPYKTAPLIEGALVFHNAEACSPCTHSSVCSQKTHLCSDNLDAESVAKALVLMIKQGPAALREQSADFSFTVYRQTQKSDGRLVLENTASIDETVRTLTGQLAWTTVFDPSSQGIEVLKVEHVLDQIRQSSLEIAVHVKEEIQMLSLQTRLLFEIEEWLRGVSRALLKNDQNMDESTLDMFTLTISLNEWGRVAPQDEAFALLSELKSEFAQHNIFSFYKKAKWTLALISSYLSAKQRIYGNLKSQLKERGYNYVSGPGKLS